MNRPIALAGWQVVAWTVLGVRLLAPVAEAQDSLEPGGPVRPSIASIFESQSAPTLEGPAAENPSSNQKRLCIKSFPHPDERLAVQLPSVEMKRLYAQVQSLLTRWEAADPRLAEERSRLPHHLQVLHRHLEERGDVEQARRYADFLLLDSLYREHQYSVLKQEAQRLRTKHSLTHGRVPWDLSDPSPFYSSEALGTMSSILEYLARASTVKGTPEDALPLIAEFLDEVIAPDSERLIEDVRDEILTCFDDTRSLELDQELWRRLTGAPAPSVLAAAAPAESGSMWLLLRGRNPHVLQVGSLGNVGLYDPDKAAAWYQEFCRRSLAEDAVEGVRRFTLHPLRQSREIEFSPVTFVALSKDDQAMLLEGQHLPAEHALTRAVTGDPIRELLWLNPFQQYRGTELQDLGKLLEGLRRCYPDREFLLDLRPEQELTRRLERLADLQLQEPGQITVLCLTPRQANPGLAGFRQRLIATKVEWVDVPPAGALPDASPDCRLVVLLGNDTEDNVRSRIRDLGEKRWFGGRGVLIATESVSSSISLQAEVVGRADAAALFALPGSVAPDAAHDFLADLAANVTGAKAQSLEALIRKALRDRKLTGGWSL
jgi:hypothetical protein